MWSLEIKLYASCVSYSSLPSTTSNMRAHLKNVHSPRLSPQALCLQHVERRALRKLLHSYARTQGRSVSLMAWASESFVKDWNWGTISRKYLYKELCLVVIVCPPVIDIMRTYRYSNSSNLCVFFRVNIWTSFWSNFDSLSSITDGGGPTSCEK